MLNEKVTAKVEKNVRKFKNKKIKTVKIIIDIHRRL